MPGGGAWANLARSLGLSSAAFGAKYTRRCACAAVGAALILASAPSAVAAPRPFGGLSCRPDQGVRFCRGNGSTERIPSWDGVPLDVDVTLPPAKLTAPYPTIVMLHGWPDDKTELELGGVNATPHYNNIYFARHASR